MDRFVRMSRRPTNVSIKTVKCTIKLNMYNLIFICLIPMVSPNPVYQGYQELMKSKYCHRNNNQNFLNQLLMSVYKEQMPKTTEQTIYETMKQLINGNPVNVEKKIEEILLKQLFTSNQPKLNNFNNCRPKTNEPVCFNTHNFIRNGRPMQTMQHEEMIPENLLNFVKEDSCDLETTQPIEKNCYESPKVVNNYFIVNPNDEFNEELLTDVSFIQNEHLLRNFETDRRKLKNNKPIRRNNKCKNIRNNRECFDEGKCESRTDTRENKAENDKIVKNNTLKRKNNDPVIARIPNRYYNEFDMLDFMPKYRDRPRFVDFVDRHYPNDVINREQLNRRKYCRDKKVKIEENNNKEIDVERKKENSKKAEPVIKIKYIPKKAPANESNSEIEYVKPTEKVQKIEDNSEELQPVFIPDNFEDNFEETLEKNEEYSPLITLIDNSNNLKEIKALELPGVETICVHSKVSYPSRENENENMDYLENNEFVKENISIVVATSIPETVNKHK